MIRPRVSSVVTSQHTAEQNDRYRQTSRRKQYVLRTTVQKCAVQVSSPEPQKLN